MNIEVKKSGIVGAGRGAFARKRFESGDVILSLNRPYVAELQIERLQDTCAWCFVGGEYRSMLEAVSGQSSGDASFDLKFCTACRKVKYCSKVCQTRAWKREHKYECKIIGSGSTLDLPHGVRAVIKLLGRLAASPDKTDENLLAIASFKPAANDTSLNDFQERSPEDFKHYNLLAYGAWKYAGSPDLGIQDSETLAKRLLLNIMCNSITLSSPLRDEPLGIAFDPILCSANHSCEPNAFISFNQPSTQLRALRPITPGSEIFIQYTDVTNPFTVRQYSLRDTYGFSCKCPRCLKGAKGPEDAFLNPPERLKPGLHPLADSLIQRHQPHLARYFVPSPDETSQRRVAALQAEAFRISGLSGDYDRANRDASEAEVRDALEMCLDSGLWGWTRQPVPHLVRQLLLLCVGEEGGQYRAWRIGAKMHVEVLPGIYPQKFHAVRVVHCLLMMRVTGNLCQGEGEVCREMYEGGLDLKVVFLGFLLELHEQVGVCYGRESHMGRFAEALYEGLVARAPMGVGEIRREVGEMWPKFEVVARGVDVLAM